MPELINFKLPENDSSLTKAGLWVERFLNDLGGDYSISGDSCDEIILSNCKSCPCFCTGALHNISCDEMERILSRAVTIFDSGLTIGFTSCSREGSGRCEVTISS